MNKKPNAADALAGIIKARRAPELPAEPVAPVPVQAEIETPPPPSPAPLSAAPVVSVAAPKKARNGKSSDPNYNQFSVYLPKSLRKKVGRALDDADNGDDFSDLVELLLKEWLKSST